jgi:formylglycine-generating enzyme required for sulfatase activity
MGSSDTDASAIDPAERPQHRVQLAEYYIGRYEVTVAQFRAFVKAKGYRTTAEQQGEGYAFTSTDMPWQTVKGADWQHPQGPSSSVQENHPVVQVSWDDAVAFCTWASEATGRKVRLPTEAEWEKAARGTEVRLFPWGNEPPNDSRCNYELNVRTTTPVGQYSPRGDSPYGCADMAGNVSEWVQDWFGWGYYQSSPQSNPPGPTSGDKRVVRGGSWELSAVSIQNDAATVRAACRKREIPSYSGSDFGFRVCMSA